MKISDEAREFMCAFFKCMEVWNYSDEDFDFGCMKVQTALDAAYNRGLEDAAAKSDDCGAIHVARAIRAMKVPL